MLTVREIRFLMSDGETTHAAFGPYSGWEQWHCDLEHAAATMPIMEALAEAAREDPKLARLLEMTDEEEGDEEE